MSAFDWAADADHITIVRQGRRWRGPLGSPIPLPDETPGPHWLLQPEEPEIPVTLWRAFVGHEGERTEVERTGVSWTSARQALLGWVRAFAPGDCQHCIRAQLDAESQLAGLVEGQRWYGDVDWDELKLEPVSGD